jgi:hypothetical protein
MSRWAPFSSSNISPEYLVLSSLFRKLMANAGWLALSNPASSQVFLSASNRFLNWYCGWVCI